MHCQTAHHVADELAAMAGLASNHLDRHALPREDQDRVARRLPKQLIFVPQALGTDQVLGVDRRGAHRLADRQHRPAHGVEEGGVGVLHQVSAIGGLDGIGQSPRGGLSVTASTTARDDRDLGMSRQPGLHCTALAIRQQGEGAPPLQIDDDGAVAPPTTERPVVDADHARCLHRSRGRGDARCSRAGQYAWHGGRRDPDPAVRRRSWSGSYLRHSGSGGRRPR